MSDDITTTDPAFIDFETLAIEDPEKATNLLTWLFMDPEVAARRHVFLTALSRVNDRDDLLSVEEFDSELDAITEVGVFNAIKSGKIELLRLSRMASNPNVLVAAYEAVTCESAPWMSAPGKPRQRELGRRVTVTKTLAGGSEVTDARPVLPEGQFFGASPDRHSFLIRCNAERLQDVCPYRIVVARCVEPDRTETTQPVVVTQNSVNQQFEGSVAASRLLSAGRSEFQTGDELEAFIVTTVAEVFESGLTIDNISNLLETDPVAKNSQTVKDVLKRLIAEMKSEETPRSGDIK